MKKNIKEEDFFDEKEKKIAGKQDEEMDTSFLEPKKHHFFAKFLIFLLILAVSSICTYYFVLDTPKKSYITVINKLEKLSNNSSKNQNINYNISTNIISSDSNTQKVLDIINNIELSGITNHNNNTITINNIINYKNEELLDLTYLLDLNNKMLYFKLNKILDKIIKLDVNNEIVSNNIEINENDYQKLINSFINDFKLSLENANFKRTITKLNNEYVFKETLLLDETLNKELLTKLLHDDDFIQAYAKFTNTEESKISDELNKELSNLDIEVTTLTIYKTIIKNEILKIELYDENNNVTIDKGNNKYNYEFIIDNELTYKGYIDINKNKLILNIELLKEKLNIKLNITYSKSDKSISPLDTKNATNYTELTEEDLNKIMKYIEDNKTFKKLLEDLGLSQILNEITNM